MATIRTLVIYQLLLTISFTDGLCKCGSNIPEELCTIEQQCPADSNTRYGRHPIKPRDLELQVFFQKTKDTRLQAKLNISWLPPDDVSNLDGFVLQITQLKYDGSVDNNYYDCTTYHIINKKSDMRSWKFQKTYDCF